MDDVRQGARRGRDRHCQVEGRNHRRRQLKRRDVESDEQLQVHSALTVVIVDAAPIAVMLM
jgi:hypothetical protein